jgi:hypothetical protein
MLYYTRHYALRQRYFRIDLLARPLLCQIRQPHNGAHHHGNRDTDAKRVGGIFIVTLKD